MFVNGFVNETQQNCPDGLQRDVMAWTRDQLRPARLRLWHRHEAVTG
jgi:hypothetical protein